MMKAVKGRSDVSPRFAVVKRPLFILTNIQPTVTNPAPKRSIAPELSQLPRSNLSGRDAPHRTHNLKSHTLRTGAWRFSATFREANPTTPLPRFRKVTVICHYARLRIALSPDTNMADENGASGGSAARELEALNRSRADVETRRPGR